MFILVLIPRTTKGHAPKGTTRCFSLNRDSNEQRVFCHQLRFGFALERLTILATLHMWTRSARFSGLTYFPPDTGDRVVALLIVAYTARCPRKTAQLWWPFKTVRPSSNTAHKLTTPPPPLLRVVRVSSFYRLGVNANHTVRCFLSPNMYTRHSSRTTENPADIVLD